MSTSFETEDASLLNKRMGITARRRDGHEFPVEVAVWAVRTGRPHTLAACAHDITERKRAEDALREQARRDPPSPALLTTLPSWACSGKQFSPGVVAALERLQQRGALVSAPTSISDQEAAA